MRDSSVSEGESVSYQDGESTGVHTTEVATTDESAMSAPLPTDLLLALSQALPQQVPAADAPVLQSTDAESGVLTDEVLPVVDQERETVSFVMPTGTSPASAKMPETESATGSRLAPDSLSGLVSEAEQNPILSDTFLRAGGQDVSISQEATFKILTQQVINGLGCALPVQKFPRPIIEHRLHTRNVPS